ncbi:hypothetical protein BD309DRAFT_825193, partial [Dichomitus squalens]
MRTAKCEVWITFEGERLPEYDTQAEDDGGKTLSCFVPSEAGKSFALEWRNSTTDALFFSMNIDGSEVTKGNFERPGERGGRR